MAEAYVKERVSAGDGVWEGFLIFYLHFQNGIKCSTPIEWREMDGELNGENPLSDFVQLNEMAWFLFLLFYIIFNLETLY